MMMMMLLLLLMMLMLLLVLLMIPVLTHISRVATKQFWASQSLISALIEASLRDFELGSGSQPDNCDEIKV